jgi:hypothetical protein
MAGQITRCSFVDNARSWFVDGGGRSGDAGGFDECGGLVAVSEG